MNAEVGNWFDKAKNAVEDFGENATEKISEYSETAKNKAKETYNNWRRLET